MISNENRNREEGLIKKLARFLKYNRIFMLFLFILLFFALYSVFGNKGLIDRLSMQNEKVELEKILELENIKTNELQKEIDALQNSDKRLEEVARERFGMTKEGEEVYKIEIDSTEKNKNE